MTHVDKVLPQQVGSRQFGHVIELFVEDVRTGFRGGLEFLRQSDVAFAEQGAVVVLEFGRVQQGIECLWIGGHSFAQHIEVVLLHPIGAAPNPEMVGVGVDVETGSPDFFPPGAMLAEACVL